MAISPSRFTLGFDRAATSEAAANKNRLSLLRKGMRSSKRKGDYKAALAFSDEMNRTGAPAGTTGSAEDTASIARGRVAAREALSNQMRSALPTQTREGKIAAAKAAGTFDSTREQFNKANAGKKTMDETGNIADVADESPSAGFTGVSSGPATNLVRKTPGSPPAAVPAVDIKPAGAASSPPTATPMRYPGSSREENIAIAKADGSFGAARDQFNRANEGNQEMDGAGNITNVPGSAGAKSDDILRSAINNGAIKDPELDQKLNARAKGGPVKAGKPYLVGEEGPEIVVPKEDGEVIPNDKLRKKSRKALRKMLSKR
jgi:hypothetical protein